MMKNSSYTQICLSKKLLLQILTQLSSTWTTRIKMQWPWCKRPSQHPMNNSTKKHLISTIKLSTCYSRLLVLWTQRSHHALPKWQTFNIRWEIFCRQLSFRQNQSSFKKRFQDTTTHNWLIATPTWDYTTTSADTGQRDSNIWTDQRIFCKL